MKTTRHGVFGMRRSVSNIWAGCWARYRPARGLSEAPAGLSEPVHGRGGGFQCVKVQSGSRVSLHFFSGAGWSFQRPIPPVPPPAIRVVPSLVNRTETAMPPVSPVSV